MKPIENKQKKDKFNPSYINKLTKNKYQQMSDSFKKIIILCSLETYFKHKDTDNLKV